MSIEGSNKKVSEKNEIEEDTYSSELEISSGEEIGRDSDNKKNNLVPINLPESSN